MKHLTVENMHMQGRQPTFLFCQMGGVVAITINPDGILGGKARYATINGQSEPKCWAFWDHIMPWERVDSDPLVHGIGTLRVILGRIAEEDCGLHMAQFRVPCTRPIQMINHWRLWVFLRGIELCDPAQPKSQPHTVRSAWAIYRDRAYRSAWALSVYHRAWHRFGQDNGLTDLHGHIDRSSAHWLATETRTKLEMATMRRHDSRRSRLQA